MGWKVDDWVGGWVVKIRSSRIDIKSWRIRKLGWIRKCGFGWMNWMDRFDGGWVFPD